MTNVKVLDTRVLDKLIKKIARLEVELIKNRRVISRLKEEKESQLQGLKKLEKELSARTEEVELLSSRIEELNQRIAEIETSARDKEDIIKGLEDSLKSKEKELENIIDEREKYQDQIDELNRRLAEAERAAAAFLEGTEGGEARIRELKAELRSKAEGNARLRSRIEELEKILKDKDKELTSTREKFLEEIKRVEKESLEKYKRHDSRIKDLNEQLQVLREDIIKTLEQLEG